MRTHSLVRRAALIAAPWLLIVAAWYAVRASGLVSPALVPAPHDVLAKFAALLQTRLPHDILMSTQRVLLGVLLGIVLAVPVGFLLGWYKSVRSFVDPVINFSAPCRPLPSFRW